MEKTGREHAAHSTAPSRSAWVRLACKFALPKNFIFAFLSMLLSASSWAQDGNFLNTFSPKLRKFMIGHPAATKVLTNALTDAFSSRSVRLFYFYSDDESKPRAFHFYPYSAGQADVIIGVRENQHPLDEFICILYETINSKSEKQFAKVLDDARSGSILRADFARAILKIEFSTDKQVRDAIRTLDFGKKEKSESYSYRRLAELPDDFEESLAYQKKVSPRRDPIKDYELQYDAFRKAYKDYEMKGDAPK
jgi:hypothetical protein